MLGVTGNRRCYDRSELRYPSDLTDEEWALTEPLIPQQAWRQQWTVNARERALLARPLP